MTTAQPHPQMVVTTEIKMCTEIEVGKGSAGDGGGSGSSGGGGGSRGGGGGSGGGGNFLGKQSFTPPE